MSGQEQTADDLVAARMLMGLGRWDEASRALSRLLVASPQSGSLWCLLAECRLGQRNWAAAAAAGRAAIGLDPRDVQAHLLASWAAGQRRQPHEALELARSAARIGPSSWRVQAHLAEAAAAAGATIEARRAACHAVALAPDGSTARVAMGLVAHGRAREALEGRVDGYSPTIDPASAWLHDAAERYNRGPRGLVGGPRPAAHPVAAGSVSPSRVESEAARQGLPVSVRSGLARVSYLLLLAGCVTGWWAGRLPDPLARAVPITGVLAASWYVTAFVRRLEPPLRRGLVRALVGRWILLAAGVEAVGVTVLLTIAALPHSGDRRLALGVALGAVTARMSTYLDTRRTVGRALAGPAPYLLGTWVLWILAVALSVLALVRVAAVSDGRWLSSAPLGGVFAAAAALATVATIVHRIREAAA